MHWQGELLHIHVAPRASAPMQALSEARLVAGIGIEGDRYATRLGTYSEKHHIDRQTTLIEVEALEALARDHSVELAPDEHRRNLTTRNMPLNHLVGQYFRIGDCVLYGGRLNVPCLYLEKLVAKKVFKPLINRSGLNCRIVVGGIIRIGDRIHWCDPGSLDVSVRLPNEATPARKPSPFRAVFVMRSRCTEDCLAESLAHGVRQYVILGAGLDTFAYRQPPWASSLRIYEVDQPASQEWKRQRLEAAKVRVAGNLTFAPIDFETTSLREGLAVAGFDFRVPSFFSLLGVTQYLTIEAIESIFSFVRSLPQCSQIVVAFIVPDDLMPANEAGVFAAAASASAERGEPWLTRLRPMDLKSRLTALGFSQVTHLSPDAAQECYFRGRTDELTAWSAEQMMHAIV